MRLGNEAAVSANDTRGDHPGSRWVVPCEDENCRVRLLSVPEPFSSTAAAICRAQRTARSEQRRRDQSRAIEKAGRRRYDSGLRRLEFTLPRKHMRAFAYGSDYVASSRLTQIQRWLALDWRYAGACRISEGGAHCSGQRRFAGTKERRNEGTKEQVGRCKVRTRERRWYHIWGQSQRTSCSELLHAPKRMRLRSAHGIQFMHSTDHFYHSLTCPPTLAITPA